MVPASSEYDILHRFKREMDHEFPVFWYFIIGASVLIFIMVFVGICSRLCCCYGGYGGGYGGGYYGGGGGMYAPGYYGGRGYYGKDKEEKKGEKSNSESTSQV